MCPWIDSEVSLEILLYISFENSQLFYGEIIYGYIAVNWKRQQEGHLQSVPLSPCRQDQIRSTRQMHKACVHPSITLLSVSLSFSLFPFSSFHLKTKREKIKVRPPSTWSCRKINFHILVLSDPLTVSRNVTLSSQVIYDYWRLMACLHGALCHCLSFLSSSPLIHNTQIHTGSDEWVGA